MQFKDVIGQRFLINQITKVIDSGKVSHTQLFCGNMGYGTFALAIAYAQYLYCTDKQHFDISDEHTQLRADSCGTCPNCKKIQQLLHADIYFVFPNTARNSNHKEPSSVDFIGEFREYMQNCNFYSTLDDLFNFLNLEAKSSLINVKDSAYLIDRLSLKSYEGGTKTAFVWLPEKLNESAANKLLKTLEEPSEDTLIILVSENRDKILKTILSRTQSVDVHKIDTHSICEHLMAENPASSLEEMEAIAKVSEGNYFIAKDILKTSEQNQKYTALFVNWMRRLFKLDMLSLSKIIDEICKMNREEQKSFLTFVLDSIRACFLKNIAGIDNPYRLKFGDDKFTAFFPTMITERNIEKIELGINEALFYIERNAYSKITFMDLSFTISKLLKNR